MKAKLGKGREVGPVGARVGGAEIRRNPVPKTARFSVLSRALRLVIRMTGGVAGPVRPWSDSDALVSPPPTWPLCLRVYHSHPSLARRAGMCCPDSSRIQSAGGAACHQPNLRRWCGVVRRGHAAPSADWSTSRLARHPNRQPNRLARQPNRLLGTGGCQCGYSASVLDPARAARAIKFSPVTDPARAVRGGRARGGTGGNRAKSREIARTISASKDFVKVHNV